jgi:hypothetical protein
MIDGYTVQPKLIKVLIVCIDQAASGRQRGSALVYLLNDFPDHSSSHLRFVDSVPYHILW